MLEAPNPKHQMTNKFQIPMPNGPNNQDTVNLALLALLFRSLGSWALELAWDLEFGVWSFPH
jgi:hypothetical protein